MSRYLLTLRSNNDRARAAEIMAKAPPGTRLQFNGPRRSLPQNSRLWAMLSEVSDQIAWHGQRLTPSEWKLLFLDALKREYRMVPSLDGTGAVALGKSSSDLSKQEMSDLFTIIEAFGAEHGVVFRDIESAAA